MSPAEHQRLAREARAHIEAAAALLGWTDPGGARAERTDAGRIERLTEAAEAHPKARFRVREAQAIWWQLAVAIRRVAHTEARRHFRFGLLPLEDLQAEALIGLYRGVLRWDPDRGVPLEHYAGHWCRAHLRRSIDQIGRTIRSSSQTTQLRIHIVKLQQIGITSASELSELTGASREAVERVLIEAEPMSLDTPIAGHDELKVGDSLGEEWDAEAELSTQDELAALHDAMEWLDLNEPRLGLILRRRLEGATLRDIGDEIGITRERVRQLEIKALWKVAHLISMTLRRPVSPDLISGRQLRGLDRFERQAVQDLREAS